MTDRLRDISSLEEFRLKALGLLYFLENTPTSREFRSRRLRELGLEEDVDVSEIRLSKGLEEYVAHILQNGTDAQRFATVLEKPHYGIIPGHGAVKTMVYHLPNDTLLLCLIATRDYIDMEKVKKIVEVPQDQIKKASLEDLGELGMVPYGCHGFPQSDCERNWRIVIDDQLYFHPIYLDRTSKRVGDLFSATSYYTEIMQARFPNKVINERISRSV